MKSIILIITIVLINFNGYSQEKKKKESQTKISTTSTTLDTVVTSKTSQASPASFIELYSKKDPTTGNINEMWYAKNRNTSKAIKVTVKYWKNQIEFGEIAFEDYSLSPGETKVLRAKYSGGTDTWNAQVVGATY